MKWLLCFLMVFVMSAVCQAGALEDGRAFNSKSIRAHADRYGFIPSDSQVKALNAATQDPEKVLTLLTGYVQKSYDVCVDALKKGTSNPKLKSLDPALRVEVLKKCERDGKNWSKLLKELKSIEVGPQGGFHTIKGKSGKCPHQPDGSLDVEKFKAMQ